MKRIGFVDYKLDNFHAKMFLKAYRQAIAGRGAIVAGCYALDAESGKAWAAANDVAWCDSAEELNDRVDAFMILAPANPELHLQMAETFFPFGKTTYVDKTFAPNLATAKLIFALADKHKTAIQTTSALRYTSVQAVVFAPGAAPLRHMITWGGGSSYFEYSIHPVEMLISCMGHEAVSLMRRGTGEFSQLLINFSDNRTGVANIYTPGETPFSASVTTDEGTSFLTTELDRIFFNTASAVLDLFESGQPNIDRRESLMIRRILDVADEPEALAQFIDL